MEDTVAPSPTGATAGRTTAGLAWDEAGSGQPVVLVHAGVADRRMWDPLMAPLAAGHRVIRYDARGFGETLPPVGPWAHYADLLGLVDELRLERPHLVAASMGAGIVVEAALARPPAIASLVLAAPGGALFAEPPDALRALWRDEVAALDRGDVDGAVEVNLRAWVDGPSRQPGDVDPEVRAFVGRMQREAFELPEWDPDEAPESELDPPASGRFAEIRCPLTVVVGELDQAACLATAERLGDEVSGATVVRWAGVAHMLTLERPDAFAELVLAALATPA